MFSKSKNETERLSEWRRFRQQFPTTGTEQDVAQAFKNVPIQRRFIDYYTPSSWPSVFEIVQQDMFCQSGLTLVLAATLHNLGFIKTPEVRLEVISNHVTGNEGLVLSYAGNYYNFIAGQIVDTEYVLENSTQFDRHVIAVDKLCS